MSQIYAEAPRSALWQDALNRLQLPGWLAVSTSVPGLCGNTAASARHQNASCSHTRVQELLRGHASSLLTAYDPIRYFSSMSRAFLLWPISSKSWVASLPAKYKKDVNQIKCEGPCGLNNALRNSWSRVALMVTCTLYAVSIDRPSRQLKPINVRYHARST